MIDTANNPAVHLAYYSVWDRTTRWFHWINVLCIIGLIAVGVVILNDNALGVSNEGKVILKSVHVYIGYVFAVNLAWRIIWGFIGGRFARWKAILPGGNSYFQSLRAYITSIRSGQPLQYQGHNPLGKLMVALLLLLLVTQASTGLVLAGTDLYLPPFGNAIAKWVAVPGGGQAATVNIKPGSKANINPVAYAEMRKFRKPFITLHVYSFYTLLIAIVLHVVAVVVTEIREKSNLVSAMFTGKKVLSRKPEDLL